MAELTVDLTYGTALFQAAEEAGKKDLVLEEVGQVLDIFEKEPDLFAFFNYPAISAEEKKEVLKNIFEGRICTEVLNLLYILVDKRRTAHFPKIVKAFKDCVNQEDGVTYGVVYSVEPLKEEQLAKFEEQTSALLKTNAKLENKLDPKLIGGVKILIDGRVIDASIRKRFEDLESKIMEQ